MSRPAAAAAVTRELLVRHLEAWAPAAIHRARRATYLHGYADADGGVGAEAAVRVLAELADLLTGRGLAMVVLAADAGPVEERLAGVQRDLRTPPELAVHTVAGATEQRLGVALKAAGARGAPLFAFLDAATSAVPDPAALAAAAVGKPTDLLLVMPPGTPHAGHRSALTGAGLPLVTTVELVADAGDRPGDVLIFATSAGKSLEAFKNAMWSVDEFAGIRYRDPHDPDGHLIDISLNPHPGPLRRELLARVRQVGPCTVTELRQFTLTDTVYRASDATRVLTALLGAGALTRQPPHGRLGGDVVIGPGVEVSGDDD